MISIFLLWTFHLYVEAGIEFNFSEFIFIFDLVLGFYCSGQKSRKNTEIKSCWHLIFFNERPQYWDSFLAYVAVKFNYWKFIIWKHFRGEEWWTDRLIWWREDRDRFLVQVEIKFNFSEFIFCKWKVFNFSYSGLQHFKLIIHNTIKMS
jgi:hypothetical protein